MGWDTPIQMGLSPVSPFNEFLEDAPTQVLADLLDVGLGGHRAQCWVPSATQVTRTPQVPSLPEVSSIPWISHTPTARPLGMLLPPRVTRVSRDPNVTTPGDPTVTSTSRVPIISL